MRQSYKYYHDYISINVVKLKLTFPSRLPTSPVQLFLVVSVSISTATVEDLCPKQPILILQHSIEMPIMPTEWAKSRDFKQICGFTTVFTTETNTACNKSVLPLLKFQTSCIVSPYVITIELHWFIDSTQFFFHVISFDNLTLLGTS